MELPGFFTPGSPKADERRTTDTAGNIEILIATGVSPMSALPKYDVRINRSASGDIYQVWGDATNQHVFDEVRFGYGRCFIFRLTPADMEFWPDHYTVTVLQNGREILNQPLSVLPRRSAPPA